MHFFFSGILAAVMLVGVPQVAHADDPVKVEPVEVSTTKVPTVTDDASGDAAETVAELPARSTEHYGLVGVTWLRGFDESGLVAEVRVRADGDWGPWTHLDIEDDASEGGRAGTAPLWVGDATGLAVRVTTPDGKKPADIRVTTVDPGVTTAEASQVNASSAFYAGSADGSVAQVADGTPTFTPRPAITSRAAWGAKKNTYCDSPRTSNQTRGVLVHHTAGSNDYSASQSASIVRAVQSFHMSGRDWCDIGYNFLVDKYGQVFEGRVGGVDKTVRGAHAGNKGVNMYTMGVSMMGTFTSTEPSAALKDAMVKLIGWRLGTTFHPAKGTYKVAGYVLNRIAGHRNVVSTACPGVKGYAWLSASGGLRDRVEAYISDYSSAIKTTSQTLGATKTGPVYVGEYGNDTSRKARFENLDMYWTSTLGTHYTGGYARTEYNAVQAQTGPLGWPTTNLQSTSRAVVAMQQFEHGRIYRVTRGSSTKAYGLWGPIAAKYRDLGEASGTLGAPRMRVTAVPKGWFRAYFTHGTLTLKTDGSVVVVKY